MVERADALCLRHYARLGPVDRELRLAEAHSAPGGVTERLVRATSRLDRGLTALFDDLKALPRPRNEREPSRYGDTVSDFHFGVGAAELGDYELSNDYFARARHDAAEAHETAKAIGLSECTPALSER